MGLRELVKQVLVKRQDNRYESELSCRRISYDQWIRDKEYKLAEQRRNINQGSSPRQQETQICFFYADEGFPAPCAKEALLSYFVEHPQVLLAYGDEDMAASEDGERSNPWFKPDWSPETFRSCFYFGSMFAVRRSLLERCGYTDYPAGIDRISYQQAGNIRKLAWLLAEKAGGFERGCSSIGHIHEILFHVKSEKVWQEYMAAYDGLKPVGNSARYTPEDTESFRSREADFRVSVIIPSKDNPDLLERAVSSLMEDARPWLEPATRQKEDPITVAAEKSSDTGLKMTCDGQGYNNSDNHTISGFRRLEKNNLGHSGLSEKHVLQLEIIVVDNGSSIENRTRIESFLDGCPKTVPVHYLYRPMPFHFSKMCNLGAESATGDLLVFLNDDVELCKTGTLLHMAGLAVMPYAGAVGVKLLYPDSGLIQHAGITNLPLGPVHKLQFLPDTENYDFGRSHMDYNVLAVTGACLMLRKEIFQEAGGFPDELPVAFNDVALCFRLYELGYSNVSANSRIAFHRESVSRGDDESPEKQKRLAEERKRLYELYPALEGYDPYYPEELNHDALDTRIRPASETAGNMPQRGKPVSTEIQLERYRQDNCLFFRVEYCAEDRIQGYGVVLGDNNACYDRALLLASAEGGGMYRIALEPQYRPDLLENMKDQIHVALCGFAVEWDISCLPRGKYRIGMTADSRVSKIRLVNWSGRSLYIEGGT